jgi:hypothetical protein
MRSAAGAILGSCFGLAGCGGASHAQLAARAAFDFGCSQEQIQIHQRDELTYEAAGCGRTALYKPDCQPNPWGGQDHCTWISTSDIKSSR